MPTSASLPLASFGVPGGWLLGAVRTPSLPGLRSLALCRGTAAERQAEAVDDGHPVVRPPAAGVEQHLEGDTRGTLVASDASSQNEWPVSCLLGFYKPFLELHQPVRNRRLSVQLPQTRRNSEDCACAHLRQRNTLSDCSAHQGKLFCGGPA